MTTAKASRTVDSLQRFGALIGLQTGQTIPSAPAAHASHASPAHNDILNQAKACYFATMDSYRASGISPKDYLGPIWSNNLEQHLIPNIRKRYRATN